MKSLNAESQRTLVMGIFNATPDSFSDGGNYASLDDAIKRVSRMSQDGADIIDIGGESTRPGAPEVSIEDELARVIPLVEAIVADPKINTPVSVDTSKPIVMAEAIKAGASVINDVRALSDENSLKICAETGVRVCLMHMKGQPRTMQMQPQYDDVVETVIEFLRSRAKQCRQAGILRENIVVDPGFGFGKSLQHNLLLLRGLNRICDLGFTVLVGISRKSMIGDILDAPVDKRLYGSLAAAAYAVQAGAGIIRVHDVFESRQVVDVIDEINNIS